MAIDRHHQEIQHHVVAHHAADSHPSLVHQAFGRPASAPHHDEKVSHDGRQLPGGKHPAEKHADKHADKHSDKHAETKLAEEKHEAAKKAAHERKEALADARWERRHEAFMKGALSCHGEWTNMIQRWVTHNEASVKKFEAYTPNDAGHGISVGLLQFNQKRGSLPDLLKAWHNDDPAKFNQMFGRFSGALMNQHFVQAADFVHTPELKQGIKLALHDREFQHTQLELREKYMSHTCEIAKQNGFKSLGGRALVADLANQLGPHGVAKALHRVPHNRPEHQRIEYLTKITNHRPNGPERVSVLHDLVTATWHKLGRAHRPEQSIFS